MTLSYTHGTSAEPLLGDTIGSRLRLAADRFGDREALVDVPSDTRWTYRELDDRVDLLARALLGLGVAKGDRVGIWAPNRPEWVLIQYATARIGAILVTVNPAYRTDELRYVLRQSGVGVLLAAEAFRSANYRAMIREVRPDCPRLSTVVFLGTDWATLLDRAEGVPLVDQELSADDPINIQYTSGTTGFPKGATLSHHSILNNAYFVGRRQGWSAADRVCVPVPFYHCFGSVLGTLAAMTHGACVVIPAPAFDARATLAAVERERCTTLYGVPTMFIAELELTGFDLSSLRTGVMAGSPCPVEVMKRVVADLGMTEVTICYGMTETSPVATQSRPDDDLNRRVTTVGTPLPHVEVKIVDPVSGLTVPRGEPGEFCTRGYSVMLGYWDMPERTAEVVDAARWMHTGDLAVMGPDGYVNIVGRIKDVVIRGGENIYPTEVEEFLRSHPGILDVQVIGVPDDRYGEEVMAWVIPRSGAEPLTARALRDFCAGRIATYKIPHYVKVVDTFPLTVTGKVRKTEMRAQSIRELGLAAAAAVPTA